MAEAKNELVAFLDSDDEWMPGKLEIQRNLMVSRPDILFCFSNFAVRSRTGEEKHNYLINWHNDLREWDEIIGPGVLYSSADALPDGISDFRFYIGDLYPLELVSNFIFTGTLMVRRKEAGNSLHFGEGLPTYEDWECFGRLARKGKGAYLDLETAWQNSHGGSRLTDADIATSAGTRMILMERVWGNDPAFLEQHGSIYSRTMNEQRLLKIRGLVAVGRTKEARLELKSADSVSLPIKILAYFPGPLVKGLAMLRRLISRG